ncbi:MAG: adenylosuccinate lyase, partial [Zetaproteobacteria bacterium]
MHEPLLAISPLDGRYAARLEALRPWVSEYGLIRARVEVEVLWLIAMAEEDALSDIPPLSAEEKAYLLAIVERFSLEDAKRVKAIEQTTNHDVKAVEYFLRERLQAHPTLSARSEWIHFGCTSEDINNLAYARLIQRLREDVVLPKLAELEAALWDKAEAMRNLPMLARTHGQPASPTTMGKEWAVFALRLRRAKARIAAVEIFGKFNGATGNFQAHRIAYPEAPWPEISRRFVEERLGLVWNPLTTQIEPHDWVAELLDAHARAASVLIDFARDIWGYIALGY